MVIQVLYTCDSCKLLDVKVDVAARTTEDIIYWMDQVCAVAISVDHSKRSPHCTARSMTTLKIPMTGVNKVGGVVIN